MQDDRDRDELVLHANCGEWTRQPEEGEEWRCDACRRTIRGMGQDFFSLKWRAYS